MIWDVEAAQLEVANYPKRSFLEVLVEIGGVGPEFVRMARLQKVCIAEKLALLQELWSPKTFFATGKKLRGIIDAEMSRIKSTAITPPKTLAVPMPLDIVVDGESVKSISTNGRSTH